MDHRGKRRLRYVPMHLLDLDENIIVSICKLESVHDKLQLRLVSKGFQDMLDDPEPGSGVWGSMNLEECTALPCLSAQMPSENMYSSFYRWLLRCAPGIESLMHLPYVLEDPSQRNTATEAEEKDAGRRHLMMQILPRIAGLLPQGAEIELDMRWVTAQSLSAMGDGPQYMSQYWGVLSSFLTKLKLAFNADIGVETSSALNQLTQLKGLQMDGFGQTAANLDLQLPQLAKLTLENFGSTFLSFNCPELKNLKLLSVCPLGGMSGLPDGLERLRFERLHTPSLNVEQMLPAQGLMHLSHLTLIQCPGQPTAVKDACIASNLVDLSVDHHWAPLMAFQPPWQGVPFNLRNIYLEIPLDDGIPLVLEQLGNLESLVIRQHGAGPMHLTRDLDPFMDMRKLARIFFHGPGPDRETCWTPDALKFLGLADRRILRKHKLAGGFDFYTSFRISY